MTTGPLRLGLAGLGKACSLMLPSMLAHPDIRVVAATDADAGKLARFAQEFEVTAHDHVTGLAGDPAVDAVYVATPHEFHAEHATTLAAGGKHLLVEKPMALSVQECRTMIEAAGRHGVTLVIGHTHGASASTLFVRELVLSGRFGELQTLLGVNFTDYLYRPRRSSELDTRLGGGVLFNQLPHHVDMVRTVHPTGRVNRVSAQADRRAPANQTEGGYSALLDLEGASATVVYNGYGHFDTDDWYGWVGESGYKKDPRAHQRTTASWAQSQRGEETSALAREATPITRAAIARAGQQPMAGLPHFGVLIASLDRADLVTVADGVLVVSAQGRELLTPRGSGKTSPRRESLDELCKAAREAAQPLHDGEWGLQTVATCLAVLASSRWGQEVTVGDERTASIAAILAAG